MSSRSRGSVGPRRSGHSTSVTPSAWRSSTSPPATASPASARRYRSTWKSRRRPGCSAMRMKLGELTVPTTPRPRPKPFARTVLPAPRSPHRQIRAPGAARVARRAPGWKVSAGEVLWGPTDRGGGVATSSGEPLEVAERHRDGRAITEAHEPGLGHDPAGEPPRPGEPDPLAFGAHERPGMDADQILGGPRQLDLGVLDDDRGGIRQQGDDPALHGPQRRHDRGGDRPARGSIEDQDPERRQPVD